MKRRRRPKGLHNIWTWVEFIELFLSQWHFRATWYGQGLDCAAQSCNKVSLNRATVQLGPSHFYISGAEVIRNKRLENYYRLLMVWINYRRHDYQQVVVTMAIFCPQYQKQHASVCQLWGKLSQRCNYRVLLALQGMDVKLSLPCLKKI